MKKYLFLILVFIQSLIANQNYVENLSKLISNSLYNLDDKQCIASIKPYLQDKNEIQAIKIIDTTDNSIFLKAFKKNEKIIFQQNIPENFLSYKQYFSKIKYENEVIGRVIIYCKYKNNIQLSVREKKWIINNIVTFGIEQWSPVVFSNNGTDIDGICGDFTNKIVEKTGLKIKVINKKWNTLLEQFKQHKIDILPATYYTQERSTYGLFSKQYFKMKNYLYVKDNNDTISSFKDLNNKKLAIIKGYGTIDEVKNKFPNINIVVTKDLDDSISKVLSGEVDALYEGQLAVEKKMMDNLIKGLKPIIQNSFKASGLHYFINTNKPILKSIIQKALDSFTEKEKNDIFSKWLSSSAQVELSEKEILWLDKNKQIKFTFDPAWKPLQWADEVDDPKGIIPDVIKLIKQKSGINIIPVYSKNWEDVLHNFTIKKADLYATGDINNNKNTYFTKNNILKTPYVFLSRVNEDYIDGFKDLKDKKVGVFKNSTIHHLIQIKYPTINLTLFDNDKNALKMLKDEKLDIIIFTALGSKYYLNYLGYKNILKISYKTNLNLELKLAIRKDIGDIPISIIEKSLKSISEKEISDIVDKWTDVKVSTKTNWLLIAQIGGIVLLIILFILWNNKKLKMMVAEQTSDIQKQKEELEALSSSLEVKVQERTKELNSERKLISSIVNSQDSIVVTSDGTSLKTINKAFKEFYEVKDIEGFEEKYGPCICDSFEQNVDDEYLRKDMNGISWVKYMQQNSTKQHKVIIKKNNEPRIFILSLDSFIFEDQKFVTVVLNDITDLENVKKEIEAIHKHTRESIEYASLIQGALIPQKGAMEPYFKDYFVTWIPKDTVGGDIWLFNELRHQDECLLFFIDCTGHGVPGAFVTMIVKAVEREIIAKLKKQPNLDISPAIIMSYFNKTMKTLLRQESKDSLSNAGWDGGIIYYNRRTQILKFAGAETPLFYIDENNEFQTIKGNRYSVGYKKCDSNYKYKETILKVQEGMKFYCTTDGYLDQNGGEKDFPFGKKRFSNIIKQHYKDSMANQQNIFISEITKWENQIPNNDRNDDITVIGFEIKEQSSYKENIIEEIVKYEGVMTQNVIATAMDNIESKITNIGLVGTISTITIEYCQNMMNYSKGIRETDNDDIVPAGTIEVQLINKEYYLISATNVVSIKDKEKIEPKLIEIQSLDKQGIKKRYRELRKSGQNTHSKGGGIGMYEIAKVSDSIEYKFEAINNDKYYFTMISTVKPKKKI